MPKQYSIKERKERYRQLLNLLADGHTTVSAAKILGYSQPQVSRLAKSLGFKKRVKLVEENILGKVKTALVKRALGQTIIKEYQSMNKSGEVINLIETVEIPGDVKAQISYLQAKDKNGGWINGTHSVNVQLNQMMQGVSTNDLLLTLRSASQQIDAGGGGVLEVKCGDVSCSNEVEPLNPSPTKFSESYDSDYDNFHDAKPRSISPLDNFYDPNNGKLDEPVEGPLDNVGEDEECS